MTNNPLVTAIRKTTTQVRAGELRPGDFIFTFSGECHAKLARIEHMETDRTGRYAVAGTEGDIERIGENQLIFLVTRKVVSRATWKSRLARTDPHWTEVEDAIRHFLIRNIRRAGCPLSVVSVGDDAVFADFRNRFAIASTDRIIDHADFGKKLMTKDSYLSDTHEAIAGV